METIRWKEMIEKYYKFEYVIITLIGIFMYLLLSSGQDIWADEAYTFAIIKHGFPEIWKLTAADVHPPLYYFMLKIFTYPFKYSLLSAKVFSIIPFIIIITVGGFQLKKFFDATTALLFMIMFLMFPFSMGYSIEVRMYSWAALFVFLTAIYAFRSWKGNLLNWIFFSLFGVCAAYVHYFAMVSVGVIYVILLYTSIKYKRKFVKYWIFSFILSLVIYMPWAKCFIQQICYKINHEYWISEITLKTVVEYAILLFGSKGIYAYSVYAGFCYIIALVYILRCIRKENVFVSLYALAIPVFTVIIGIVVSILVRPIFIIRYVTPAIPLLIFFLAFAVGRMENRVMISVILTIVIIGGGSTFAKSFIEEYESKESICVKLVDSYSFVDSYFAYYDFAGHISHVLSYYEPSITIYTFADLESSENLYPNIADASFFCAENNRNFILLINLGQRIPKEFTDIYESQYIGTMKEYCHSADAYLLTLR